MLLESIVFYNKKDLANFWSLHWMELAKCYLKILGNLCTLITNDWIRLGSFLTINPQNNLYCSYLHQYEINYRIYGILHVCQLTHINIRFIAVKFVVKIGVHYIQMFRGLQN